MSTLTPPAKGRAALSPAEHRGFNEGLGYGQDAPGSPELKVSGVMAGELAMDGP